MMPQAQARARQQLGLLDRSLSAGSGQALPGVLGKTQHILVQFLPQLWHVGPLVLKCTWQPW